MSDLSNETKTIRIQISEALHNQATEIHKLLKQRGRSIKIDDLFSDAMEGLDERYFKSQLDKHSPDDYILELAKDNPEIKRYLILQAKRALELIEKGEAVSFERKKPGPKPKPQVNV